MIGLCSISSRGEAVPSNTFSNKVASSWDLESHTCTTGYLVVLLFWLLYRLRTSVPMYLRVWARWRRRLVWIYLGAY